MSKKKKRRKIVDGKFVLTKQPRMNHGSLYITEKELDAYYKEIKRSSKWFKKNDTKRKKKGYTSIGAFARHFSPDFTMIVCYDGKNRGLK